MNDKTNEKKAPKTKALAILLSLALVFSFFDLSLLPNVAKASGNEDHTEQFSLETEGSSTDVEKPRNDVNEEGEGTGSPDSSTDDKDGENLSSNENSGSDGKEEGGSDAAGSGNKPGSGNAPGNDGASGSGTSSSQEPSGSSNNESVASERPANNVAIEELYITTDKYQVEAGEEFSANLTIRPDNASYENITWSVVQDEANDFVGAEIVSGQNTKSVRVKTIKEGSVKLRATVDITSSKTDATERTVAVTPVKVTKVAISGWNKEYLKVGESVQLSTVVQPSNAGEKEKIITWSTSNPEVVSVDKNGKIAAKKQGFATIYARANSGKYDSLNITVYNGEPHTVSMKAFQTTKDLNHELTFKIPSDGSEVNIADYVPSAFTSKDASGGNALRFTFTGKVRDWTKGSLNTNGNVTNEDFAVWPTVTTVKVVNKKVLYKTENGSYKELVQPVAVYNQAITAPAISTDKIDVGMKDWPWDKNSTAWDNSVKKAHIYIYEKYGNGITTIFDSGELRYANTADHNLGGYTFNLTNSIYQIDEIKVTNLLDNTVVQAWTQPNIPDSVFVPFKDKYVPQSFKVEVFVSPRAFDITYSEDGYAPESIVPINGNQVVVSNKVPEKDGYIFGGWQFNNNVYQPGDQFEMPEGPVHFEAWWQPASEMITYSVNTPAGGSVTNPNERIYEGHDIEGSYANANSGYEFVGWYNTGDMNGLLPKEGAVKVADSEKLLPEGAGAFTAVFIKASAEINGIEVDYDGKPHTIADPEVAANGFNGVLELRYPTSDDSNKPVYVDAGTYKVKVQLVAPTLTDKVLWEDTATIKINPRAVTVHKELTTTYSGKKQTLEIADEEGFDTGVEGERIYADVPGKVSGTNADVYTKLDDEKATYRVEGGQGKAGNYGITTTGKLVIDPKSIADPESPEDPDDPDKGYKFVSDAPRDLVYNGKEQKWVPVVKDGDVVLDKDDYDVEYMADNFIDATANDDPIDVVITGKGNYTGKVYRSYRIAPRPVTVSDSLNVTYDGAEHVLEIAKGKDIETGVADETIKAVTPAEIKGIDQGSYDEICNEPSYEVIGGRGKIGNYTIMTTGMLTIGRQSIADPDDPGKTAFVSDAPLDLVYNGVSQQWVPTVTNEQGVELEEGKDYKVEYRTDNFTDATEKDKPIEVTITGIGNYEGAVDRGYAISPKPISVFEEATVTYNADEQTLEIANEEGYDTGVEGERIYAAKPATIRGTNVGTYTQKSEGDIAYRVEGGQGKASNYRITESGTLTITPQEIVDPDPNEPADPSDPDNPAKVTATVDYPQDVVYNSQDQTWHATVKNFKGDVLAEGIDYTVEFNTSNRTDVTKNGKPIEVTIEGMGNYSNSVKRSYRITPVQVTINVHNASKVAGEKDPKFTGEVAGTIYNNELGKISYSRTVKGERAGKYKNALTAKYKKNANYVVSVDKGDFTITAEPVLPPVPAAPAVPVTPPADGIVPAAAPEGGAPAPAAPVTQITDDATPLADTPEEMTLQDDENPLGAFDEPHCWVHWLMMIGMIVSAIYTVIVIRRRMGIIEDVDKFEDNVSGRAKKDAKTSERVSAYYAQKA